MAFRSTDHISRQVIELGNPVRDGEGYLTQGVTKRIRIRDACYLTNGERDLRKESVESTGNGCRDNVIIIGVLNIHLLHKGFGTRKLH